MEYVRPAVFWIVQVLVLALFALGLGSLAALVRGCIELRRRARAGKRDYSEVLLKSPLVPAVSTIAIPPDASPESRQFARRLLDLHFGRNEVVIVLDGPSEAQLATWTRELKLARSARVVDQKLPTAAVRGIYESRDPIRVVVVDKEHGGKADAWNAGVNVATSPVIGFLDPDSEFEMFVLLKLIQPMLEASEETVAVCGGGPIPAAPGLAAQFAALESLRAWLTRGAAFAARNLVLPIPGSCILAQRSALIQSGGFTAGVFEMVVRLHAFGLATGKPYRIVYHPESISFGHTPSDFDGLRRLVDRDQGQVAHAYHARHAVAGPFSGQILNSLYYDRSLRPKLEVAAYVLTVAGLCAGWVSFSLAALLLMATAGMGMVLSMGAVVLREVAQPDAASPTRVSAMFFGAVVENLGYRQLRDLWLIAGFSKTSSEKQNRGKPAESRPPAVSASQK